MFLNFLLWLQFEKSLQNIQCVQKTEQITQTNSQTKLDSFANLLALGINYAFINM